MYICIYTYIYIYIHIYIYIRCIERVGRVCGRDARGAGLITGISRSLYRH